MIRRNALLLLALALLPAFARAEPAAPASVRQGCLADFRRVLVAQEESSGSVVAGDTIQSGARKIQVHRLLGEGGMGEAYLVEVTENGRSRPLVWRQTIPESVALEADGLVQHERISTAYRQSNRQPSEQYVVPLEERVIAQGPRGRVEGTLMPMGGPSVDRLRADHLFQLTDAEGKLIGHAEEVGRRVRRNGRLAASQCRAIHDLSSINVVHRDVKPGNIVIFGGKANSLAEVDAGQAHFAYIDFGLAQVERTPGQPGLLVGTPGYIDPGTMTATSMGASRANDLFAAATIMAENLLGLPIGVARRGKSPLVTEGIPGAPVTAYFQREGVRRELLATREKMVRIGVSPEDLAVYDDLSRFIFNGLHPDPAARMAALRSDPRSIYTMDGNGVQPAFEARLPGMASSGARPVSGGAYWEEPTQPTQNIRVLQR
jgi:serine/threonine protein kinase